MAFSTKCCHSTFWPCLVGSSIWISLTVGFEKNYFDYYWALISLDYNENLFQLNVASFDKFLFWLQRWAIFEGFQDKASQRTRLVLNHIRFYMKNLIFNGFQVEASQGTWLVSTWISFDKEYETKQGIFGQPYLKEF